MIEQRGLPRGRTLLPAQISFNRGRSTVEAVVRDLSETGARLNVSEGIALPETFRLHLKKTDEWREVRLCWRRGDVLGVQFEGGQPTAAEEASAAAQRIRALEAEVAKLRRVLEELRADPGRIMQLLDQAV